MDGPFKESGGLFVSKEFEFHSRNFSCGFAKVAYNLSAELNVYVFAELVFSCMQLMIVLRETDY